MTQLFLLFILNMSMHAGILHGRVYLQTHEPHGIEYRGMYLSDEFVHGYTGPWQLFSDGLPKARLVAVLHDGAHCSLDFNLNSKTIALLEINTDKNGNDYCAFN